jgi:hypothetical protein
MASAARCAMPVLLAASLVAGGTFPVRADGEEPPKHSTTIDVIGVTPIDGIGIAREQRAENLQHRFDLARYVFRSPRQRGQFFFEALRTSRITDDRPERSRKRAGVDHSLRRGSHDLDGVVRGVL